MASPDRRRRRLRVVSATFVTLNLVSIVAVFTLNAVAQSHQSHQRIDDGASAAAIAEASVEGMEIHPFGAMMVPYEHHSMQRFVERLLAGEIEDVIGLDAADVLAVSAK